MAKAIIIEDYPAKTIRIEAKKYLKASNIEIKSYPKVIRINETLPFRVRFTNIMVPGYGPNNIPGIGLQIIGYSNYIL